jgi:hypothetical protein
MPTRTGAWSFTLVEQLRNSTPPRGEIGPAYQPGAPPGPAPPSLHHDPIRYGSPQLKGPRMLHGPLIALLPHGEL